MLTASRQEPLPPAPDLPEPNPPQHRQRTQVVLRHVGHQPLDRQRRQRPTRHRLRRLRRHAMAPEPPAHPEPQAAHSALAVQPQADAAHYDLPPILLPGDRQVIPCPGLHLPPGRGYPVVGQPPRIRERQARQHPHHRPVVDQPMHVGRIPGVQRAEQQPSRAQRLKMRLLGKQLQDHESQAGSYAATEARPKSLNPHVSWRCGRRATPAWR